MDRKLQLELVATKISSCIKCSLCEGRIKTVPGEGNENSKVLFVGIGPGHDEDISGRPFVGRAGKLLDNILKVVGIDRNRIFIANVVKCRPPNNREPTKEEITSCKPFLDLQLKIIKPQYIVCLGNTAASTILNTEEKVSYLRGSIINHNGVKVVVTFHPSYALRGGEEEQKEKKKAIFNDLILLKQELL